MSCPAFGCLRCFQSEYPSEDLSISLRKRDNFFADFKEFDSWRRSLKDNPLLEELLNLSEKMLKNEKFVSDFFDCWHICVDLPNPD